MSKRECVLQLKNNDIITLTYEDFDFDELKERLKKLGLKVSGEQLIWCG